MRAEAPVIPTTDLHRLFHRLRRRNHTTSSLLCTGKDLQHCCVTSGTPEPGVQASESEASKNPSSLQVVEGLLQLLLPLKSNYALIIAMSRASGQGVMSTAVELEEACGHQSALVTP
jgi:hypothetical protein